MVLKAWLAQGVDPVCFISGALDHSADVGVLKGALVQQSQRGGYIRIQSVNVSAKTTLRVQQTWCNGMSVQLFGLDTFSHWFVLEISQRHTMGYCHLTTYYT